MSSTSSSEQNSRKQSATEALASRYRHLFVLPSAPLLLIYGGIASFLLSVLSKGAGWGPTFFVVLVVFIMSASAISSALIILDRKTIATFRRVLALLMAGEILWLIMAAVGAVYAWAYGSANPLTNAILFGAFVCMGFEFLVINGAFERNVVLSLALAAAHPAATVLVVRVPELTHHFDPVALVAGAAALAVMVAFTSLLGRRKTSVGHDALALFQAFMKTWTAGQSDDLESMIADHSEEAEVTTKVIRLSTKNGNTFLVLPGVHPGPFHPVGSYDLPGVMSRTFNGVGPVMTLHRPGGHERNLATRKETSAYAQSVKELASSLSPEQNQAKLSGPLHARVGNASVSALSFSKDMIMTVSFAPLGSDDIDTKVEDELSRRASESGFDLSVIDAHNSIDPDLQSPVIEDSGWKELFEATRRATPERFEAAYCHSSEIGFAGRGDLTENGIALLMLRAGTKRSVLVLADANNSVAGLRSQVASGLESAGFDMVEFCTSDSHNLAARGLTAERGYEALGEATPPASIADATVRMARLAEARLAPAECASSKMQTRVRVFGSRALEEFASMAQSSSRFSRKYFRFATATVVLLLLASILF